MLAERHHLPHISTGDLLREHVRKETALGKEAKGSLDKGQLVPDPLVLDMLFKRIQEKDCAHGYILDGFPRTLAQAKALQARLKGHATFLIINLKLPDSKVLERLSKRVSCEHCGAPYHLLYSPPRKRGVCDQCGGRLVQREDDREEVVRERIRVYHQQTEPLISFYKGLRLLHSVHCDQSKEAIFSEIDKLFT